MLELKGVEEDPILVIREGVVDFLIPNDSTIGRLDGLISLTKCSQAEDMSTYRDVNKLDPESIADQIVGQDGSPL